MYLGGIYLFISAVGTEFKLFETMTLHSMRKIVTYNVSNTAVKT